MGFSTSGAAAILFIGLLIAVSIAYPALETANDRRMTAIEDRDQRALDVRNTDVAVTSAVYEAEGNELTLEIRNTGSTTLSVTETDLLVDGIYQSGYETAVEANTARTLWQPGETLTMSLTYDDPTRVKIVTENGIAKTVTELEVTN
ncbi:flagellin [Natronoglomus mannanivorans]|uniref:Flagellin n=1 Tax=Natronoglomus mannanivorans TaxID=2979990 RepID=A0AAP3E4B2_9EURY|nr:flagellin [Halobacteria archaeon AArc-xg1-1]